METKINPLGILALLGLLLLVFYIFMVEPRPGSGTEVAGLKEVPRFESYAALLKAFEEGRSAGRGYGVMETLGGVVSAPTIAKQMGGEADSGAVDYSITNIQVEGVDEADIVKSDGKYIYNFSGSKLVITDAYPIESAAIVSKTDMLPNVMPSEMFVSGNKLLLFGNSFFEPEYPEGVATREMMPYYYGGGIVVQLYDISDRASPNLEKELKFDGSYLTSRLIGENAYFVISSWPRSCFCPEGAECILKKDCIIPLMWENGVENGIAEATEIGYLLPMPAQSFITIASLNLDSGELQKETIVGNAQNVYASLDNIYLAGTSWLAPSDVPVVKEATELIVGDVEKTVINKFGLKDGAIGFVGQGIVPGHVLNQFSMDEFGGNFRIATTVGHVSRFGSQSSNNLYVLDKEMNVIGSLEDLAPGEQIYSARFMGEKAYMVTFRKIDPLFVIDVSDPANPKVLGKLKIPGYSDYLHPIDETHIIGVGKETIEAAKGDFSWYQGLKMAVFDVSDVSAPVEMHKVVIGYRGTDSYALHDHKAFLYDNGKELLVLPITLAEILESDKSTMQVGDWPEYGEYTFQGAFVFRLTLENGFEERGRITHVTEEDELKRGYYFGDEYSVKRALYIGDVLYTLSGSMLKANDLATLQELKEFSFE
jgi:inhibitor of cysteine peptidase